MPNIPTSWLSAAALRAFTPPLAPPQQPSIPYSWISPSCATSKCPLYTLPRLEGNGCGPTDSYRPTAGPLSPEGATWSQPRVRVALPCTAVSHSPTYGCWGSPFYLDQHSHNLRVFSFRSQVKRCADYVRGLCIQVCATMYSGVGFSPQSDKRLLGFAPASISTPITSECPASAAR